MKNIFLLLFGLILGITGCKKDDQKNVVGVWEERIVIPKFAGTRHWVKLTSERTFQMKLMYFTDVVDPQPVPCSGNRTDYVMGNYTQTGQELKFEGSYCDSTFTQTRTNCKGDISFTIKHRYIFSGEEMIWDYEKEDQDKIWLARPR